MAPSIPKFCAAAVLATTVQASSWFDLRSLYATSPSADVNYHAMHRKLAQQSDAQPAASFGA